MCRACGAAKGGPGSEGGGIAFGHACGVRVQKVQRVQRVQKVQRVVASPGGDEYEYSVTFSFPPYSSFCAAGKESWYLP